jgi:hypothetical protein
MKSFNIKKIFAKLRSHKRTEYKTISSKAHHDWKTMVIMFFFLWIVVIFGSGYIFIKINKGEIFLIESKIESKQSSVDKKLLETTVASFEGRKIEFEKLKTEKPKTVDPSL